MPQLCARTHPLRNGDSVIGTRLCTNATSTGSQGTLFPTPEPTAFDDSDLPYVRGSETSKAAAESYPNVGTCRRMVYDAIAASKDGLTDQQIQRVLMMDPSTERPRRVELVQRKMVRDSGRKIETSSGSKAVVW